MEKTKTALNWLLDEYFGGIENCTPDFRNYIKTAVEMEKQQLITALYHGANCECSPFSGPEAYYKGTFIEINNQ